MTNSENKDDIQMKKKTYVALMISGLAMIWGIGAWYTGKQIVHYLPQQEWELEERLNQEIKMLRETLGQEYFDSSENVEDIKYRVELDLVERRWFSSDVHYRVMFDVPHGRTKVIAQGTLMLYHGPLPLNRLKQFRFFPKMLSFDYIVDEQNDLITQYESSFLAFLHSLQKTANPPYLAKVQFTTGYSGVSELGLLSMPVIIESDKGHKLVSSPVKLKMKIDPNGSLYSEVTIDDIEYVDSRKGGINIKNLVLTIKRASSLSFSYEYHAAYAEIRNKEDKTVFDIDDIGILMTQSLQGFQWLKNDITFNINKMALSDLSIGELEGHMTYDIKTATHSKIGENLYFLFYQPLPQWIPNILLGDNIKVNLDKFSWRNGSEQSTILLAMDIDNRFYKNISIDKLDVNLDISLMMMKDVFYKFEWLKQNNNRQLSKQQQEHLKKKTDSQFTQMLFLLNLYEPNLFMLNDERLHSSLRYLPQYAEVDMNGKKIPLHNVIALLKLLGVDQ